MAGPRARWMSHRLRHPWALGFQRGRNLGTPRAGSGGTASTAPAEVTTPRRRPSECPAVRNRGRGRPRIWDRAPCVEGRAADPRSRSRWPEARLRSPALQPTAGLPRVRPPRCRQPPSRPPGVRKPRARMSPPARVSLGFGRLGSATLGPRGATSTAASAPPRQQPPEGGASTRRPGRRLHDYGATTPAPASGRAMIRRGATAVRPGGPAHHAAISVVSGHRPRGPRWPRRPCARPRPRCARR